MPLIAKHMSASALAVGPWDPSVSPRRDKTDGSAGPGAAGGAARGRRARGSRGAAMGLVLPPSTETQAVRAVFSRERAVPKEKTGTHERSRGRAAGQEKRNASPGQSLRARSDRR